jgi:energy-coupling factor transport system substrate-specific component
MLKSYSIKDDFSLLSIMIIPIGIALNVVGDQLVAILKLPIYLDVLGTVLTGMLTGPWVAALTGFLTNLITGIIRNPTLIPYGIVNAAVGLVAGFCSRRYWFTKDWRFWALTMFLMTIITNLTASPITVFFFSGINGNGGTSLLTAGLIASGQGIWKSVLSVDLPFTLIDRIISFFVSLMIIRVIPERSLIKFACGQQYIRERKGSGDD